MTDRPTRPTGTFEIRTPAQLRALRDPVRASLLRCLDRHGPQPVAELARRLGRTPESLYYHVRALVKRGFVRAEGKRPSGRRHHVVYGLTYRELLIDQTQRSRAFFEALADHYGARLRRVERDMDGSLEADRWLAADEPRRTGLLQVDVRLSDSGLRRFRERAVELLDELMENEDEDGGLLNVTIAFTAVAEAE